LANKTATIGSWTAPAMAMAAAAQSKSSAAAEERQPEVQARLGGFFSFFSFLAKYYFSIINFWEINFAVSGD
jgi:hypothetical protein